MKKLSLQWRITLMTALLIGVTCVAMNWLINVFNSDFVLLLRRVLFSVVLILFIADLIFAIVFTSRYRPQLLIFYHEFYKLASSERKDFFLYNIEKFIRP